MYIYQGSATALLHIIFTLGPKLMKQPLSVLLFVMLAGRREIWQIPHWFLKFLCHFLSYFIVNTNCVLTSKFVGQRCIKLPQGGVQ